MKNTIISLLSNSEYAIQIINKLPNYFIHRHLNDNEIQIIISDIEKVINASHYNLKYYEDTIKIMEQENKDIETQELFIEPKYMKIFLHNKKTIPIYNDHILVLRNEISNYENNLVNIDNRIQLDDPILTSEFGGEKFLRRYNNCRVDL
jgi:hypothetical protein